MPNDDRSLPEGAGTTTGSTTTTGFSGSAPTSGTSYRGTASSGTAYADEHETGYRPSGRAVMVSERRSSNPNTAAVVGAALAGAIAGAAIPFMLAGRSSERKSTGRQEDAFVNESVTINRSARELYDFWRNFENLPQFMDNIKSVTKLDEKRSHWVIKAPVGTSVEFDSRVTEDQPGRLIAWTSEEGASVPNSGRVEFIDNGSGSTTVRTRLSYDPPAGAAGRLVAKLFQREPEVQARQDLDRLKKLMEGQSVK